MYNLLGNWSYTFRSQVPGKYLFQHCLKSLFVQIFFTISTFLHSVSVGFIMLQKSRSFSCSIIQGSVSHRQSLKFHRKQFGCRVICKVRWVHMVALLPLLFMAWVTKLFMSREHHSVLLRGSFLTWWRLWEHYKELQMITKESAIH